MVSNGTHSIIVYCVFYCCFSLSIFAFNEKHSRDKADYVLACLHVTDGIVFWRAKNITISDLYIIIVIFVIIILCNLSCIF